MVASIAHPILSNGLTILSCGISVLLAAGLTQPPASSSTAATKTSIFIAPTPEVGYMELRLPDVPPLNHPLEHLPSPNYSTVHLVLRLGDRRVYVYEGDEVVTSYPVAVGRSDAPTPTGRFTVFQMIENPIWQSPWTGEVRSPGPASALGLRWIGFARLDGGIVGFHGTPTVDSIGRAASNGCVRMHNEDVVALFEQIEIGTPVVVEP